MPLSVQDLHEKQFHVRFRGFDIEEVDSFLELVSENYALLIDENKKLSTQIETVTQELDRVKNQESSFRNAIISAQKIADEMRQKSREEANNLLSKAHEEIKALKDEAHKEVTDLESRVETLKGMQHKFEQDIQNVIAMYQANLHNLPDAAGNGSPVRDEAVEALAASAGYDEEETESAALAELAEAVLEAEELRDTKPDFSDLYEKINLGDDLLAGNMSSDDDEEDENNEPGTDYFAGEGRANIPDLDSEILFNLHDPLDDADIGIDVPIRRDKDEE
jgi:cell division initiation protein